MTPWIRQCRAYKCGISKDLFTFQDLLHDSGAMLFRNMQSSSMHCLSTLLPPKKTIDYVLEIVLRTQCSLSVFKRSFINWCLLRYRCITIVT